MTSIERPYVLFVAEEIYIEVVNIKKKIKNFLILMRLKILLDQKYIKTLVVVNFMMNGLIY